MRRRSLTAGPAALWQLYAEAGDAAPVFGVAHEYAHHVQVSMGVPPARTPTQSVAAENQADCLAGAVMGRLHSRGIVTDDDFTDLDKMVALIASEPDVTGQRTHGILSERHEAAVAGVYRGPAACNAYLPATPVWAGR
ncbi:MAG: neutral zinc metallopeptidase [Dermatophilaceae bacterium]